MSIIVEDGTIVANANSFCDRVFADNYHLSKLYSETWNASTGANKDLALMTATSQLDTLVHWNGFKTDVNSSLSWPRTFVTTRDGQTIGSNEIPIFLKRATAELAGAFLVENRLAESEMNGINKLTVGPIIIEANQQASRGFSKPTFPRAVIGLISGFGIVAGNGSIALVRS